MTEIVVPCPRCSGTGTDTHEDRHAGTNRDTCGRCGGEGSVPAATGQTAEASAPPMTETSARDAADEQSRQFIADCDRAELVAKLKDVDPHVRPAVVRALALQAAEMLERGQATTAHPAVAVPDDVREAFQKREALDTESADFDLWLDANYHFKKLALDWVRTLLATPAAQQTPVPAAASGVGLREKVARAICRSAGNEPDFDYDPNGIADAPGQNVRWRLYLGQADAALAALAPDPAIPGPGAGDGFRVGRKVPRNIYRGDEPICMVATDALAHELVGLLNATRPAQPAATPGAEEGLREADRLRDVVLGVTPRFFGDDWQALEIAKAFRGDIAEAVHDAAIASTPEQGVGLPEPVETKGPVFPNYAGRADADDAIAAELEAAGIDVWRFEGLRDQGEVKTSVGGSLHGWSFRRAWYYWIADGPGIELAAAERLHARHPRTVRVNGHCGCPSPREQNHGLAIGSYHVDTPAGLKGLADTIRRLVESAVPATPHGEA